MVSASSLKIRPFVIAWLVYLITLLLIGVVFARIGVHALFDFRVFYAAGTLMRTHPSHLYNLAQQEWVQHAFISSKGFLPFYHPSYEALIYAPFSMLTYRSAYLAYIAFNMLLLMACFFAARPAFSSFIPDWQPRPGSMFFIFYPLLVALAEGQDSILFLLLCCLTWRQLDSDKDLSAGCFLALALFKFQLAVPIALLIAMRRGWRFSAGFLIVSVGVVLLCIGLVGPSGTAGYIQLLFGALSPSAKNAIAQRGMGLYPSAMTNLAGLFYGLFAHVLSSRLVFGGLVGICSLGIFAWSAYGVRRGDSKTAFSIAILCGILVSYHIFIYDLTLVLLPIALLADRMPRYILLALFGVPIALLGFGARWFFPMSIPVLAMLVYTLTSVRKSTPSISEATHTAVVA